MPDLLPTSELLISHIISRILIVSAVPEEDDEDYEGEDDDKQEGDDNRNHAWACLFNLKFFSQFVSPLIWIFRASWSCFFDLRVIWFDEIRFGFLSIEIVLVYQKSMFPLWQVFVFLTAKRFFSMLMVPCRRCFNDTTSMFFHEDVNVRSFRLFD